MVLDYDPRQPWSVDGIYILHSGQLALSPGPDAGPEPLWVDAKPSNPTPPVLKAGEVVYRRK